MRRRGRAREFGVVQRGNMVTMVMMLLLQHLPPSFHSTSVPSIVWWTPRLFPHWDANATTISCKAGQCLTSNSLDATDPSSDAPLAFIFYGTDFEVERLPLPRQKRHRWALLHEESPINNYLLSHDPVIKLFNYTATFRRESDYPLTTLFLPDIGYLTRRQPVPLAVKNRLRRRPVDPLAPVLYVQSHCDVASDRDAYVRRLSGHVGIDSYGKCLNNRSLPVGLDDPENFQSEPFLDFVANYKFHLAFENAACPDYVTEKLFRALHVGSVPVYRGTPTAGDWAPAERSVIIADSFATPRDLADFLIRMDADDELYETYLEFKRPGGVTNEFLRSNVDGREWGVNDDRKTDFVRGFECFVCDSLSRETLRPKFADATHMGCPPPRPAFPEAPDENVGDILEWIDTYRYSGVLADAVSRIIETNATDSSRVHHVASGITDEL